MKSDELSVPLSFSNTTLELLFASPYHFVITGANGWLGKATIEMLRQALGDQFKNRVTALGSRSGVIHLNCGDVHPVHALLDWNTPIMQPTVVFHYAFLTKDKVSDLSTEEYIARNLAISDVVRSWISTGLVKGVVLPSSGAVYDFLQSKSRDSAAVLYGKLKYEDELAFRAVCEPAQCSLVIARIFNLAGPFINKLDSYALASFISQTLEGKPITIRAQRPVLRSYYFIGDLLELCVRLLLSHSGAEVSCFDVAGDEVVELLELAHKVADVVAVGNATTVQRMPIQSDLSEDRYVGQREAIMELELKLGIKPMSLMDQIKLTADFILKTS